MSDHPGYQAGAAWSQLLDTIRFIGGKTTDYWIGVSEGTWKKITRVLECLSGFFELLPDPRARDRALSGIEFEYAEVDADEEVAFESEPLTGE